MLNMKDMSSQNYSRYSNIIVSVVSSIIEQTPGVSNDSSAIRYRSHNDKLKHGNIHVYFKDDKVVIDLYLNMIFGYSVPDVVIDLQAKIVKEVEQMTKFSVESVNINISSIIFN